MCDNIHLSNKESDLYHLNYEKFLTYIYVIIVTYQIPLYYIDV